MKPSTGAYVGAALFVGLIVAFSSLGDSTPSPVMVFAMGLLGAASHLALLPAIDARGSSGWTRACGYTWVAIDVMLNVGQINGLTMASVTPLRLGGHIPASIWIADAALLSPGPARPVGVVLAALLAGHALTAPWIPPWVIFIPFMLIPIWLGLLGRSLTGGARAQTVPGFTAS